MVSRSRLVSRSWLMDNRGRFVDRSRGRLVDRGWGRCVRSWVRSNRHNWGMVNWDMVDWGMMDRGMVDGSMMNSMANSVNGRSMTVFDGSMAMLVSHGNSQKGGKCNKSLKFKNQNLVCGSTNSFQIFRYTKLKGL